MIRIANTFADRLDPKWGIPMIKPRVGEAFDANNDLFLADSCTVLHRDGHITRGTETSVTHDALIEYNRRHLTREALEDHYGEGDEHSEGMMMYGANG